MKHDYTNETIQTAIDAACKKINDEAGPLATLELSPSSAFWQRETPIRLTLARELLERLPEPTPPVFCPIKLAEHILASGDVQVYGDGCSTKSRDVWILADIIGKHLPTPPVSADGKTPGDIAYDAFINGSDSWEASAQAVLAAFGGNLEAAIARMEAVTDGAIQAAYWESGKWTKNVRDLLIAAAREGQGEFVDWKVRAENAAKAAEEQAERAARFEANGKVWNSFKSGDPMPKTEGQQIETLFDDNSGGVGLVEDWTWDASSYIPIGWRYADEPTQAPPWTPQVGDTVRLKSGGVPMTVKTYSAKIYTCAWFDHDGLHKEDFHVDCLKAVEPATKEKQL